MNSKIVFSALLLTVAAVFCVALFQSFYVSDLKKVQTNKHFYKKAEFEAELPKLETAIGGPVPVTDAIKGKALFFTAYVFPLWKVVKKPVAEGGCLAPATTTVGDIYTKGKTQGTTEIDKCIYRANQGQIQIDEDALQGYTKVLTEQLKKVEPAITDDKIQEYVAQGRVSSALCEIAYEKVTAELLKDTTKDATHKECLDAVKVRLTPAVYAGYKLEDAALTATFTAFISAKKTAFNTEIKTECDAACTGTDVEKADCKTKCTAEADQTSEPLAHLLLRLTRSCATTDTSTYAQLKALYKIEKNKCVIDQVEKQKALVNNGMKLFFSTLAVLALLIFGF